MYSCECTSISSNVKYRYLPTRDKHSKIRFTRKEKRIISHSFGRYAYINRSSAIVGLLIFFALTYIFWFFWGPNRKNGDDGDSAGDARSTGDGCRWYRPFIRMEIRRYCAGVRKFPRPQGLRSSPGTCWIFYLNFRKNPKNPASHFETTASAGETTASKTRKI